MPEIKPVKTMDEWDAKIKQHSLHLKHDSQLFFLEESVEAKIPCVNRDLMEILLFPDAKKKEICQNYIESGEITDYFSMKELVVIDFADQVKIDNEYSHEVDFYTAKLSWLKDKLTCCQKEMELRADKLVVRKPKGTTYYVDFTNGHDVNNDGSTAVKTNGDGPFATLDKYTSIAVAGDIAKVRRGMTQAVSQDVALANDGTAALPITLEADYEDAWGDFVDLSVTGTATLAWGSKTVTFSANISGVLAAGDWIYVSGDTAKDYAYEVKTVSTVTVTLYLPYKGGQAGSGKTVYNMQDAPIWNTAAGDYEVNIDGDHFWKLQGIHFRGTDSNGMIELDSVNQVILKDLIFTGNHSGSDYGVYAIDDSPYALISKCRGYDCSFIHVSVYNACFAGEVRDCFYDGNSSAACYYLKSVGLNTALVSVDTEIVGATYLCGYGSTTTGYATAWFRNCPFTISSTVVQFANARANQGGVYFEDYDGVKGDNRQIGLPSTDDSTAFLQSEATTVRSGGGATSIEVAPGNALIDDNYEASKIKLFEYPIYAVKDVEKTYTAYFKSSGTGNWTADPLNTELWIEAEYWGHATVVTHKILKSTGVCDFNGDDTNWLTLTVTVTPLQTGVLYLRGYYCKPKEAGSNIFYCDTKIGVA